MADKAVLVGVNRYKRITPLRGCLNDLKSISAVLVDVFGFDPDNIRQLTDEEAVKSKVKPAMDWLLDGAGPGDRLVFHFSGHGSYKSGPTLEEDDDSTELICLYDMDWPNSDSYFTDDELREWTKTLLGGANLLVILDNCHSGSGTRALEADLTFGAGAAVGRDRDLSRDAVPPERTPLVALRLDEPDPAMTTARRGSARARDRDRERSRDLENIDRLPLARFVMPPPEFEARSRSARPPQAFARSVADGMKSMNHVLIAACKPDQTAADAFLSDDYHGAFTFSLCRHLRDLGASGDRADLIERIRGWMVQQRYRQVPQLEGPTLNGPLFPGHPPRSSSSSGSSGSESSMPSPNSVSTAPKDSPASPALTSGDIHELVGAIGELVRTLKTAMDSRASASSGRSRDGLAKQVIYVHGIGNHPRGYSNGWYQSMRDHAPSLAPGELGGNRHEVHWSDLVNAARSADASRSESDEAAAAESDASLERKRREAARRLREALEERAELYEIASGTEEEIDEENQDEGRRSMASRPSVRGNFSVPGLSSVDDFASYMTNPGVRAAILRRFAEVARPLLETGSPIEIISHSWGAVVAYEGLRELDAQLRFSANQVRNWFTVGAALAIAPVRWSLRRENRDGRKPRVVQRWVNLNARGDIVGGPLSRRYEVDPREDFVNLESFADNPLDVAGAHSSYFLARNLTVNRDIFGRRIEDRS